MAASTAAGPVANTKSKSAKSGSKPSSKVASKPSATHPPWKDIIKACIAEDVSNARSGVSRSTIKKYAEVKYKMEINAAANSQLNRAIAHGTETGIFSLPKGPSGKVKLAKKPKDDASKENTKPPSKTSAKKPQAKDATAKPKPAVKKPSGKTIPKTSAKSTTKPSSAKKTTKKVASAKNAAKVAVTKQKAKSAKPSKPLKSKPKATKAAD